jgi:CRP-like cAMP-binding protein
VINEICVLSPNAPSPVTVVAYTSVELYSIKKEDLDAMGAPFDAPLTQALQDSINLHNPSVDKIGYMFRDKVRWARRKDILLDEVMPKKWLEDKASASSTALGTDMARTFTTLVLRSLETGAIRDDTEMALSVEITNMTAEV